MTVVEEQVSRAATVPTRRISYEPGLDGLRAVALLSIFVVHANVGLAPGGFLAVSTFFTLSGFLITALLAAEHDRDGRINLVAFWGRRARRLLPASMLAIVLIAAATLFLGDSTQVHHLLGDVAGSLAYVANWRFLLAGTTYAGEFSGQSPLLHFWSLAIEEQFYLVFPLLAVGAFALTRRLRGAAATRMVAGVLAAGVIASIIAGLVGSISSGAVDRLYFRTDIRAGELLIGALFGLWWVRHGRNLSPQVHRAIRVIGSVLLVVMVGLVATSDYHDRFWYRGGLTIYSLVTVGVILAAVDSGGPLRRVLSFPPLVKIGAVSYGAYLVHWPLFMWLFTKTSLSGPWRLAIGSIVTLALAFVSYYLVELPIRERRVRQMPKLFAGAAMLVVGALVLGFIAPHVALGDENVTLDNAAQALTKHLDTTAAARGEAPTVGLFGDSTALITSLGLATFDDTDPTIREGKGWAGLGCTINAPAEFQSDGQVVGSSPNCTGWLGKWRQASDAGALDEALVLFGPWEVKTMRVDGDPTFRTIGQPAQDALVEKRLTQGIVTLLAKTPVVIIATAPYVEPGRINGRAPAQEAPDADHTRMDRLNAIIAKVAAKFPQVAVMDLATWIDHSPDDRRLRPDGVHFTEATALELSPRFAATLADIYRVAHGEAPKHSAAKTFPVSKYAVL